MKHLKNAGNRATAQHASRRPRIVRRKQSIRNTLYKAFIDNFASISAIGFFGSVLINSLIFWFWGLTFLQVATPNDVIISGLSMIIALVALCIVAWFAYSTRRDIFPIQRLTHLFCEGLFGFVGTFFALMIFDPAVTPNPMWLVPIVFFWIRLVSSEALAGLFERLAAQDGDTGIDEDFGSPAYVITVTIFMAAILFISTFMRTVSQGQYGGEYFVASATLPSGCIGQVLWTGERAVVARCTLESSDTVLILSPENVMLVKRHLPRMPTSP